MSSGSRAEGNVASESAGYSGRTGTMMHIDLVLERLFSGSEIAVPHILPNKSAAIGCHNMTGDAMSYPFNSYKKQ